MPLRHTRQAPPARGPVAPVHRGPQAVSQTSSATLPFHAPNAALLIDFDNVTMGIRSDLASELKSLLSSDIVKGKVSVQRAYADWRRYPQYIVPLSESSIDLIFAPAYGSSKKNATDIRLAIDALELVFTRPEIGTFILLSGDSDFSSLVIKLKEYGKYVIGVGIRESSSDLLVQNCDEYYSYNALAGLVNTREEEIIKWDPWELASEALQRMKRNGDVMRADRLKQVMQQIDGSFDEKNLGMSKFSRFILEAAQRGILSLHKMETGQYEVDLPKNALPDVTTTTSIAATSPVSGTTTPALPATAPGTATAPAVAAHTAEESNGESTSFDDRRGRGRNRRGRGRGRDREERNGNGAQTAAITAATTSVAPASSVATAPSPAITTAADEIGVTGMRLTRDEAFDLVQRAVQSAATVDSPTRASDVRGVARELLGRDSESLSERNFIRILQDAHDADIVDLRRRGDDYEVAPAVVVAPIADQLTTAESVATPSAPVAAAPVTPRGMGPRGLTGRGFAVRGKKAELPSDLLSIGVVDYGIVPNEASPAEVVVGAPEVEESVADTRETGVRSGGRQRGAETSASGAPSRGGRGAKGARGRKSAGAPAAKKAVGKGARESDSRAGAKPAAKSAAKSGASAAKRGAGRKRASSKR